MLRARTLCSVAVLAASALLVLGCTSPEAGRPGDANDDPALTAADGAPRPVLLGLVEPVGSEPEVAALPTRAASWDLGLVEVMDGARAPLRGLAAWPEGIAITGSDPAPLVLVLHGSHAICRNDPAAYGSWPCPVGTEIENEQGLRWLLEVLAASGYVAIAPALNVQYTFGAGESFPAVRTAELVARTLAALDDERLPVSGARVTRDVVLAGHSIGGQDSVLIARAAGPAGLSGDLGAVIMRALGTTFEHRDVSGVVLIQPALNVLDALELAAVPTAIVVSECDGDVGLTGATYLSERLGVGSATPVALLLLDGGSHNATNGLLPADSFPIESPRCETEALRWRADWDAVATEERQRLASFLPGLVAAIRAHSLSGARATGPTAGGWAARVFEEPVITDEGITLVVMPAGGRPPAHPSLSRAADEVVDATLVDGISTEGARVIRCPSGYYTPYALPGSEPCHRPELGLFVGRSATLAVAWDMSGARVSLPVTGRDGDVLRLRACADPADIRLAAGPIRLRIHAEDGSSIDVELPVPPVRRLSLPPFELAMAFLPWQTVRIELGGDLNTIVFEILAPAAGSLQLVSIGVD